MIPVRSKTTSVLYDEQYTRDFQYRHKLVSRELCCTAHITVKGNTEKPSRLRNETPSFRENSTLLQYNSNAKKTFRRQLSAIPNEIRESTRYNLVVEQDVRRRGLQDHQFKMVVKLEKILRKHILESGQPYEKFELGGSNKGVYERFFRIEPSKLMSRAQFVLAVQKVFGLEVGLGNIPLDSHKKSIEQDIHRLWESFAVEHHSSSLTNSVKSPASAINWRIFLFLLGLNVKPARECGAQLLWAYQLSVSEGVLDERAEEALEKTGGRGSRLSLGAIKDLICTPVLISCRMEVRRTVDKAWIQLTGLSDEARLLAEREELAGRHQDEAQLTSLLFKKLMRDTCFKELLQTEEVFGSRDPRHWTCLLESSSYHPVLLDNIKALRRELRNEEEVRIFRENSMAGRRKTMQLWQALTARRKRLRWLAVGMGMRWKIENLLTALQCWRTFSMIANATSTLLRVARIIAKSVRGFLARRRVQGIVTAYSDLQQWRVRKAKELWEANWEARAATRLNMYFRKYLRRKHALEKKTIEDQRKMVAQRMVDTEKEQELKRLVYKRELEQWYVDRKIEHDQQVFQENQTAEQKRLILRYRQKRSVVQKEDLTAQREAMEAKMEAERIALWLQEWEIKKERRAVQRREDCWRSVNAPETPDEKRLKADLTARMKKHVKDVLRRADKQRIPMEIPEAQDIAMKEVIEMEVNAERQRVHVEMEVAAVEYREQQAAYQLEKRAKEERLQQSREIIAAGKILGCMKVFLARKELRKRAYARFRKHFDPTSGCYYYEERRTGKTSWSKPKALGPYDLDCDACWVAMRDTENYVYYYHPLSWKMQWAVPERTLLCSHCREHFATAYLDHDQAVYCATDARARVDDLLAEGINPIDITFRAVDGGYVGAAEINVNKLKSEQWPVHDLQKEMAEDG